MPGGILCTISAIAGLMIGHQQLGYDFTIGHQFVRKPFKGDTPSKHQDIGINFLLLVETDRILPIQ